MFITDWLLWGESTALVFYLGSNIDHDTSSNKLMINNMYRYTDFYDGKIIKINWKKACLHAQCTHYKHLKQQRVYNHKW